MLTPPSYVRRERPRTDDYRRSTGPGGRRRGNIKLVRPSGGCHGLSGANPERYSLHFETQWLELGHSPPIGRRTRRQLSCLAPHCCSTHLLPLNRGWANRGFHRWINRGYRGWARIRVLASSVVHGPKACSSSMAAFDEPSPSPCPLPLGEGARRAGEGKLSRTPVHGPKACSSNLATPHEPSTGQPRISTMD
jgi:hypothetical protein